jgi:predicted regulator of Ras-like GTPase activity (Roadblock/LC7/MglB family)
MNELLGELVARSRVHAAFLCDLEGRLLASALSEDSYRAAIDTLSDVIGRTNTALQALKHGGLAESEWVYSGGRVFVRDVGGSLLCLICERSVNLQLLTTKITEVETQIRSALGSMPRQPSTGDITRIKQGMIGVAQEMLGEHAGKVVAVVKNSGDSIASLEQASDQAEKITRLFIDRKNASDLGARMRSLLDEYR